MDWSNLLVTAVVSALFSLLFGPLRAKLEDRARRDLAACTDVSRELGHLLLRLQAERRNREMLKNGAGTAFMASPTTQHGLLTKEDVLAALWRIVRALDSPDLNRKRREWLSDELGRLAGPVIDVLRVWPSESTVGQTWEFATAASIESMQHASRSHEGRTFPLHEAFHEEDPRDPAPIMKLEERVRHLCERWERGCTGWHFLWKLRLLDRRNKGR